MSDLTKGKIRTLHAIVHGQKIGDENYRARLLREFGVRSSKELSDAQLDQAIAMFHVKQKANTPHAAKVLAIWIGLANLGAVNDSSDHALNAFVRRQTGKEQLRFITASDANTVTEALKDIAGRHGWTIPASDVGGIRSREALLMAQWKRLFELRAVNSVSIDALGFYAWKAAGRTAYGCDLHSLTAQELDKVAVALGRKIKKALQKRAAAA